MTRTALDAHRFTGTPLHAGPPRPRPGPVVGWGMRFFPDLPPLPEDDLDEHEDQYVEPDWVRPPQHSLPGHFTTSGVVARTDDAVVALTAVAVHRGGAALSITRSLRRRGQPRSAWEAASQRFFGGPHGPGPSDPAGAVRYGVQLADGGRALTDPTQPWPGGDPEAPPEGHVLTLHDQGGQGDGSSCTATEVLWLWPLPPAGPLTLVVTWPGCGIDEGRLELDGAAVRAAAVEARALWDEPA